MKVYTKTGDKGTTMLLGGVRVPKNNIRIEAYGTVDELNSYIGLIRDLAKDKSQIELLTEIQDRLFSLGSILATAVGKDKVKTPDLLDSDITALELAMDQMNEDLPEMKNFVLPGGHPNVAHCHIARCVCRRAERTIMSLLEEEPVPEIIIKYVNRLSDYLFVLSRHWTKSLDAQEIPWKPRM